MNNAISFILEYIQSNSIDFITLFASVFIALETDKYLNWRKRKKDYRDMVAAVLNELNMLKELLSTEDAQSENQIDKGTYVLKVSPFTYPYWNSIQNSEKIELFIDNPGYINTIAFYAELEKLNQWENLLTQYILFKHENNQIRYIDDLIKLIRCQRNKCISQVEIAIKKIRRENDNEGDNGFAN